jgi:hypothetical protein
MSSKKIDKKGTPKQRTSTVFWVLLDLARFGEKNKWELKKDLKKSYGNIHQTVENLKEQGMIFVKSKEKSAKNPAIDVEYYDLCIGGLFQVVSTPAALQYIDEIANKQRNKAIVFKKWDYFKQKGVDKNLKDAFRFISGAMDLLVKQATLLPSPSLNIETGWSNKQVQYFFDSGTFGFFLWENARAALRQAPSLFSLYIPIWKACKSDAELSKWFNEQLDRVRNNYREILAQIDMMEKQWKEDSWKQ